MATPLVCVPTLKRYDLLDRLITSLEASTVPVVISVIDNGRMRGVEYHWPAPVRMVWSPHQPWGLATCWNEFIRQAALKKAPCIIANDDVTFAPESVARMLATPGAFVSPLAQTCDAFSCFLIRQECVDKVGYFDETISPGYAYFEDNDYAHRMKLAGLDITDCPNAGVRHEHSATVKSYTDAERIEHNRKFNLAASNFVAKWGKLPKDL